MDWNGFLDFLALAERLKCATRHCTNSQGDPESVAEHSWRAALMALCLEQEFPGVDIQRVMRMCIIHDLGEAVTGDIPTFRKTQADEAVEDQAVQDIHSLLPEETKGERSALFEEMARLETPEARLFKILDKVEAVIQHNESPLSTWEDLEFSLQREYGVQEAAWFPQTKELREAVLRQTEEKIAKGV